MLNTIENYRFGKMVINGKDYTADLIIFTDEIKTNWRRKKGHSLHLEDLQIILERDIEILVVGTGKFGLVEVSEELKSELESKNIEIIVEKSDEAVKKYNDLMKKNAKVAGAFHLNC